MTTKAPNKTNHTFGHYSVTLTWDKGEPYAFEVWDTDTGGDNFYMEGMLKIKNSILLDYDGVTDFPNAVAFSLHEMGIGFAPYVLSDSLFNR